MGHFLLFLVVLKSQEKSSKEFIGTPETLSQIYILIFDEFLITTLNMSNDKNIGSKVNLILEQVLKLNEKLTNFESNSF